MLRYTDSWCKIADASLDQLILRIVCNGVSPELVIHIRKKKTKTFSEALTIAEDYADAQRGEYIRPVGLESHSGSGQQRNQGRSRNMNFSRQGGFQISSSFNNNRRPAQQCQQPWQHHQQQQQQHQQQQRPLKNQDLSGLCCLFFPL